MAKPPGAVKASDSGRGYADSLRLPPTPGSVFTPLEAAEVVS